MIIFIHDLVHQLAAIRAELARMKEENEKLREILSKMSNDYKALQMHLAALMQQPQQVHDRGGTQVN